MQSRWTNPVEVEFKSVAGLLLIGAAKKLNTRKATGVDVWQNPPT